MTRILKKKFLQIILNHSILICIWLGIISGLLGFIFIKDFTRIISNLTNGTYTHVVTKELLIFMVIISLSILVKRILSLKIIRMSQNIFWQLRKEILSMILNTNYEQLSLKKADIQSAIVGDVLMLTEASTNVISFFTSLVLGVTILIYLLTISWQLFLITIIVSAVSSAFYYFRSKVNLKNFETARILENSFFENYISIINGFKEIYIEPKKGNHIFEKKIVPISTDTLKANTLALKGHLNTSTIGQVSFYFLITSVLLIFSVILKITSKDIISFTFALIYLLGALETIMVILPSLLKAKVAYKHLTTLKNELMIYQDEALSQKKHQTQESINFKDIELVDIIFKHKNISSQFKLGPINLLIKKGDIIFIYGGNGSGKSTLIDNLTGLVAPNSGEIKLNGLKVIPETYHFYRSFLAVVFSDFYLFKEIIGVDNIDLDKLNYYLMLFELCEFVTVVNNSFSTINLSAGQRKRLALITILLENKPVLILDEWAADQDPYFRKKFYTQILPSLREDGFTIIAITHDDQYYNCADRLYNMEFGKLNIQYRD